MKKLLFGLVVGSMLFSSSVYAKQVAFCMAYLIGVDSEMTCKGDIEGKYTPVELYHKGWIIKTEISRANSFVLVFEK